MDNKVTATCNPPHHHREAFSVSQEDNDIITEEIRRKILNLAQNFSAVVKVKGATFSFVLYMYNVLYNVYTVY